VIFLGGIKIWPTEEHNPNSFTALVTKGKHNTIKAQTNAKAGFKQLGDIINH
jgi:hypothetical protein